MESFLLSLKVMFFIFNISFYFLDMGWQGTFAICYVFILYSKKYGLAKTYLKVNHVKEQPGRLLLYD